MIHYFSYEFFLKNQHDFKKLTTRCLDIKRSYIEIDEFDKHERLILNYGHTFGHAIEAYNKYKNLSHGAAITLGMIIASKISYYEGHIKNHQLDNIINMIGTRIQKKFFHQI